jgi:hypothetical protein
MDWRWKVAATEYKRHRVKHPGCRWRIVEPVMLLNSIVVLNKPDLDGPCVRSDSVYVRWRSKVCVSSDIALCLRSLAR